MMTGHWTCGQISIVHNGLYSEQAWSSIGAENIVSLKTTQILSKLNGLKIRRFFDENRFWSPAPKLSTHRVLYVFSVVFTEKPCFWLKIIFFQQTPREFEIEVWCAVKNCQLSSITTPNFNIPAGAVTCQQCYLQISCPHDNKFQRGIVRKRLERATKLPHLVPVICIVALVLTVVGLGER